MESKDHLMWRKSSYSGNGGGNCVETASCNGSVMVRDTKNRERGHLAVDASAWSRFIAELKNRLQLERRARLPR